MMCRTVIVYVDVIITVPRIFANPVKKIDIWASADGSKALNKTSNRSLDANCDGPYNSASVENWTPATSLTELVNYSDMIN